MEERAEHVLTGKFLDFKLSDVLAFIYFPCHLLDIPSQMSGLFIFL